MFELYQHQDTFTIHIHFRLRYCPCPIQWGFTLSNMIATFIILSIYLINIFLFTSANSCCFNPIHPSSLVEVRLDADYTVSVKLHSTQHILIFICGITGSENTWMINSPMPNDAYMCHWPRPSLVQIMACRLFGTKSLSEPMMVSFLEYC